MICKQCGAQIEESTHFCPQCGTKIEDVSKYCIKCGAAIKADASFCSVCGANQLDTTNNKRGQQCQGYSWIVFSILGALASIMSPLLYADYWSSKHETVIVITILSTLYFGLCIANMIISVLLKNRTYSSLSGLLLFVVAFIFMYACGEGFYFLK